MYRVFYSLVFAALSLFQVADAYYHTQKFLLGTDVCASLYYRYKHLGRYKKYALWAACGGISAYVAYVAYIKYQARKLPVAVRYLKNNGHDVLMVYAHGFGGGPLCQDDVKDVFCDVATFAFRDAKNKPFGICYANLAQGGDITVLLRVLLQVFQDKPDRKRICLHGFSRGGGTVINLLSVIEKVSQGVSTGPAAAIASDCGLTQDLARKLQAVIRAGAVLLECPYTELEPIVNARVNEMCGDQQAVPVYIDNNEQFELIQRYIARTHGYMQKLQRHFKHCVKKMICILGGYPLANAVILPQRLSTFYQEPVYSAQDLSGYNIVLYQEKLDELVTNANDTLLCFNLSRKNVVCWYQECTDGHNGLHGSDKPAYVWMINACANYFDYLEGRAYSIQQEQSCDVCTEC